MPTTTSIELNPAADRARQDPRAVLRRGRHARSVRDQSPQPRHRHRRAARRPARARRRAVARLHDRRRRHLNDRIALGLSVYSPPAEKFINSEETLRYHTLGGSQRDLYVAVGGGFRPSSRFSFGFSVLVRPALPQAPLHARQRARQRPRRQRRSTATATARRAGSRIPRPRSATTSTSRKSWKAGYIVNVGFVVRLADNMFLGLAYHTPPGPRSRPSSTALRGSPARRATAAKTHRRQRHGLRLVSASIDGEFRAPLAEQLDLHVGGRWTDLSRFARYDVRIYGNEFLGERLSRMDGARARPARHARALGRRRADRGRRQSRLAVSLRRTRRHRDLGRGGRAASRR